MTCRQSDTGENIIELPAPNTRSWGSRKKAAVVLGIRRGLITRDEAYHLYALSPEELDAWEVAFDRGGHKALMNKAAQLRRRKGERAR